MEHFTVLQGILICITLIIVGLFAGFVGAFFGVGGGTVLVPCFLVLFSALDPNHGVNMHQAVGTSLVLVIFNTVVAARRHHAAGNLSMSYFKGWLLWLTIGCILGGLSIAYVSALFLKILFAAYLVAAIIYGIFKRPSQQHATRTDKLPGGAVKIIAGIVFGAISLLLGIAGGTFTTPFFTFFKYPIKKAMALSVAGGMVIGFIGSVAAIWAGWGLPGRLPYSLGYVDLLSVVLVAPFVMLSSPWGVKAANRLSEERMHWLYIAFLVVLVAYMTFTLIEGI